MILNVNFEELRALNVGMDMVLGAVHAGTSSAVAAPEEELAEAETLRPRLTGDLSIETLQDQRRVRNAVFLVCNHLRERMQNKVVEYSPGHEEAVFLYFEYGHTLTVLDRLDRMGEEMTAMIEVMTGHSVTDQTAASITFPD